MEKARFARLSASLVYLLLVIGALRTSTGATVSLEGEKFAIDDRLGGLIRDGQMAAKSGRDDVAISRFSLALQMKPNRKLAAVLYFARGACYHYLRKWDAALADYNEVVRLNPATKSVRLNRGSLNKGMGNLNKAFADFSEEIKIGGRTADALVRRGECYELINKLDLARGDYSRAIQYAPVNRDGYFTRAKAYFRTGNYAAAMADIGKADKLDSGAGDIFNRIAWFKSTCPDGSFRNGQQALQLSTRACEKSKWKDPDFIDTLAAACAEIGDFNRAMNYQRRALASKEINSGDRKEMKERLNSYQAHKPWREKPLIIH